MMSFHQIYPLLNNGYGKEHFLQSCLVQIDKREVVLDTGFSALHHSRFTPRMHFLSLPLQSFRRPFDTYNSLFRILQILTTHSSLRLHIFRPYLLYQSFQYTYSWNQPTAISTFASFCTIGFSITAIWYSIAILFDSQPYCSLKLSSDR